MKAFIALLLVVVLSANAVVWMEMKSLRQEVQTLRARVEKQDQQSTLTAQAVQALGQARAAMGTLDTEKARTALGSATAALGDAAKVASEKAGPTLKWLGDQATELGKQLQGAGQAARK